KLKEVAAGAVVYDDSALRWRGYGTAKRGVEIYAGIERLNPSSAMTSIERVCHAVRGRIVVAINILPAYSIGVEATVGRECRTVTGCCQTSGNDIGKRRGLVLARVQPQAIELREYAIALETEDERIDQGLTAWADGAAVVTNSGDPSRRRRVRGNE